MLTAARRFDSPAYTLQAFTPRPSRDGYLAVRALNVEVARVADLASSPVVARLRLQFWRDAVDAALDGAPKESVQDLQGVPSAQSPDQVSASVSASASTSARRPPANEPVTRLLRAAVAGLAERAERSGAAATLNRSWLARVVSARADRLDNRPFGSLAALEEHAEATSSSLLYLQLGLLPVASLPADHVASHIGKAAGLAAQLRGLPLLAAPAGAVTLPLDVMARAGLREEDLLRLGPRAPHLKDAVFEVATCAHDHLLTAREMLRDLPLQQQQNQHVQQQQQRSTTPTFWWRSAAGGNTHPGPAMGVFLHALPTRLWLEKLQNVDFDVFSPKLRYTDWRLPWKAYWAHKLGSI